MRNTGICAQKLERESQCLIIEDNQLRMVRFIVSVRATFITRNISGLSCNRSYFANGVLVSNEVEDPGGFQ